ncbi:MAG: thiol-activated cytolysin family protein, partial [Candidatus Acidiferrales bacterium]
MIQQITIDMHPFNSVDEALLRLGVPPSLASSDLRNRLASPLYSRRSNMAVCITQSRYTAVFDHPGSAADVFPSSVRIQDAKEQIVDIKPVYVSQVTYGIAFFLFVSADCDLDTLRKAINHICTPIAPDTPDQSQELPAALTNADLKLVVLGADNHSLIELATEEKGSAIRRFVISSLSPASRQCCLPISISLRYLDDASSVEISSSATSSFESTDYISQEELSRRNDGVLGLRLKGRAKLADKQHPLVETASAPESKEVVIDGRKITADVVTGSATATLDGLLALGPNEESLWPGAIVKGDKLRDAVVEPINIRRAPIKLSISNVSSFKSDTSFHTLVQEPSRANVYDLTQVLLHRDIVDVSPARVSYGQEVFSEVDEAMLKVGISGSFLGSGITANLETSSYKKNNNIVANLVQSYYSVHCEYPGSAGAFFSEDLSVDESSAMLGSTTVPLYVSSVTYGRMLLFFYSSTDSIDSLKTAVNAHASFLVGSASAEFSEEAKKTLSRSEIRVLAIGGSGHGMVDLLDVDHSKALRDYVQEGQDWSLKSPGVPIMHTLRHIDDDSLARISFSTTFERVASTGKVYVILYTEDDDKDPQDSI